MRRIQTITARTAVGVPTDTDSAIVAALQDNSDATGAGFFWNGDYLEGELDGADTGKVYFRFLAQTDLSVRVQAYNLLGVEVHNEVVPVNLLQINYETEEITTAYSKVRFTLEVSGIFVFVDPNLLTEVIADGESGTARPCRLLIGVGT